MGQTLSDGIITLRDTKAGELEAIHEMERRCEGNFVIP